MVDKILWFAIGSTLLLTSDKKARDMAMGSPLLLTSGYMSVQQSHRRF